jgi:LuxR family maltose regulon positive regulatory protein
LFERLTDAARVTVVSAPPGSGKTMLLRSWIAEAGLAGSTAWVSVGLDEQDPQRLWLPVLDALRQTVPGSALVRDLTAGPDLNGWTLVERLLKDLVPLQERLYLVLDDLHELASAEALRQLELLVMRAPEGLRFVLATRLDVRLGLHRLRLAGELTEIRMDDLRFTPAEARALFTTAGVELAEPALVQLVKRTEGWVAGLRLAALSLAGHPDPARFAAEFSGSERTVAEYLLAEVLDRQPAAVRRLLLRTSILERVNGELASLLAAGGSGGERILQDLEQANAFVVSLDAARSWFRYHHLFADLLQLEMRRVEPEQVAALHLTAAGWFAGHGFPVEAVRHAQAARDWGLATRLLSDHWPGLYLSGQAATVHALMAGFPDGAAKADPELATLAAADELAQGSLDAAERYLTVAEDGLGSVPASRREQLLVLLGVVRMLLVGQRGDLPAEAEEARRLVTLAVVPKGTRPELRDDLRALALIGIGYVQGWMAGPDQAERHLADAIALARKMGHRYLEFYGLAYQASVEHSRSLARAEEFSRQAIDLAERHGWTEDPTASVAYMSLAAVLAWRGRLAEAAAWLGRAEPTSRPDSLPVSALAVQYIRGQLELAAGRPADSLAAFRAAGRLTGLLAAPHPLNRPLQAWLLLATVMAGDTGQAEQGLAGLSERARGRGEMGVVVAALRLAQGDPAAASAALAPVLASSTRVGWRTWQVEAFLLEAIAQDALGDPRAAGRSLERALDLAEPDGVLLTFLLHPAPDLLERHAARRTAHAALIAQILGLLAENGPAASLTASSGTRPRPLLDPLSKSEIRVLGYLPTHLTSPEIASELWVSPTTVKTHMRNLYTKLDVHSRAEAVERARALGLLAPSPHER